MRPADLLRLTSVRLAASVTLLILTALLFAGGIGYGLLHSQLTARQDARVTEMFRSLEQTMLAGDEKDLIEAVATRIAASPDRSSVYLLKSRTGGILAGNIPDIGAPPGWYVAEADRLAIRTDYPYRIFSGQAGRYSLLVGLTDADLDDLREIIVASFGWAAVFALIAALAIGWVLAVRVQRRLADADAAMLRVAQGDLTARLPLTGHGDDLDRIAGSINAALVRLADVVEAMRQVSADIAHDLRTPLNRLRIRIEDATAKHAGGHPVAAELDAALGEADQIGETFAALLRIAQIEAGSRRAQFCPVDVNAVLRDVADVYRDVARDSGMTLGPVAASPCVIDGDRELLTQMFANLIENAITHCPPGSTIACRCEAVPGAAVASVADTGPGIPVAEREMVLRRLYRREKSRSTPGSGLGLSLAKAIADLHHAALALSDTDAASGQGLTVEIRFSPA